jgi:hypothetical protein
MKVGGRVVALGLGALSFLGCGRALETPPPEFRSQVVEIVSSRLDARGARLETQRVRDLFEVKVWVKDTGGTERLRATCWFDGRRRLQTVVYAD